MTGAFATIRLGDRRLSLPAGGIVGRLATAAVRIDHPSVSEVHGHASLRGRHLHLVGAGTTFRVDREQRREVLLAAGVRVGVVDGVELLVESVDLPDGVLALVLPGGVTRELGADVHAFVAGGAGLDLVPRFDSAALGLVWSTGAGWHWSGGELAEGDVLAIGGAEVRVVRVPLARVAVPPTRAPGRFLPALALQLWYGTARVDVEGGGGGVVDGRGARILRELAELGEPVEWTVVAGEVWREPPAGLRDRWDMALRRLRDRLRELGVRDDLVRTDGRGTVGLHLLPGDSVTLS